MESRTTVDPFNIAVRQELQNRTQPTKVTNNESEIEDKGAREPVKKGKGKRKENSKQQRKKKQAEK